MEETEYHHHHHHHHHHGHHGHDSNVENQGQQHTTSSAGAVNSVVTETQQQQQNLSVPNRTSGGVQATGSFHSVSSGDSVAEMTQYFPNAQTPNSSSFGHQQVLEGQTQSTTASTTAVISNLNTVNAGPYIPVSAPTAVQQLPQPIRAPFMAQQQQQRPVRPAGQPQRPQGIPSYSSQIEGLSVSQAVVNDVLVDLQTKVLNETLQQYQNEVTDGTFLEPLPPIYIRAPQPTVILRSDLNRLRAELNSRVRPPVVYRHPASGNQFQQNQFQQNQFQQNVFQAPQFPTPPQSFVPPGYADYRNAAYASSDEYNAATTGDVYRKEKEEGLYHQAESTVLNDGNLIDNVHSVFDRQGLSTTSFDRHASSYESSSFPPNTADQQQGNGETAFTSSHPLNNEQVGSIDNMYSGPFRPRQEVTFDINNCIQRCFEAHRQRVARRRAARQARRAKRHKQTGQQQEQYQSYYHTDHQQKSPVQPTYPTVDTTEQTQWEQQHLSFSQYPYLPTEVQPSQGPYIPTSAFTTDSQQYASSDFVDAHTSQLPFSSLSTTNIDATVPIDTQSSGANFYQYQTVDTQQPFLSSNEYQYTSQQTPTSYDYSSQVPYDTQNLTAEYYQQQQQVPSQFNQDFEQQSHQYGYNVENNQTSDSVVPVQSAYSQPTGTFEYSHESYQSQQPMYDTQTVDQQITQQESYNFANTAASAYAPTQNDTNATAQAQSYDYTSQQLATSDYYPQQSTALSTSQVQDTYLQPSGSYDYAAESAQTQLPTYDSQQTQQQSYQYPFNLGNLQQQSYNYTTDATSTYIPSDNNIQQTEQSQAFDSSNYYQQELQQPTPTITSQETYGQPTGTYEYTRESYQTQEPIYDYQNVDQQSSQYLYNIEGIQQQQQLTQPAEPFDYSSQTLSSTDEYQVPLPASVSVNQTYESQFFGNQIAGGSIPTGTVEYTRQAYYSQEPILDNYTTENFIQQQENESLNIDDYIKRFGSDSHIPETGGQLQSSGERQSITTVSTTPFIIQQNVDAHPSQGAAQTYDLQNYTNGTLTSSETTSQEPPVLSSQEEDQKHLHQQTEQHSDLETSAHETYSSLPLPPATEEIDQQQVSIATTTTEFPPPPSERYTYETKQQQQQTIPPASPLSSDHGTDEDVKEEEEIFDLRQCIETCYAKYQDQWNQDEQQRYRQNLQDIQHQSVPDTNVIGQTPFTQHQQTTETTFSQQGQPEQYVGTGEIHYIDGWTQTPSLDVINQSDIVQHKYDETPSSFDTKPYIPHFAQRGLSTDSREQQTIEYSPPLLHTIPRSSYEYSHQQQEQQQPPPPPPPVYDHTLPVPPHLSFNDTDYQSNFYFSPQITAQPRQEENIPFDTTEQQQQRYRAHSEPASSQQDSVVVVPPTEAATSHIFEQDTRRSVSIPMIHQGPTQPRQAPVRMLNNGRSYVTEASFERRLPRIDPATGLCLVPCPQSQKYAHLPPHLRPELFCIELPPPSTLPPVPPPPPPPPAPIQGQQRWCVKCCCVPGQTLIKKVVYKQAEEEQQEESGFDFSSVIDQMATRVSVRYGNSIMEEGDAFVSGNYHEQLRIIDFPVYVSGQNDTNLTPLVPAN